MMKKTICTLILALALLLFPTSGFAYWPTPIPMPPIPLPSLTLLDEEVSVPDAALNAALHEYAGIPSGQALHKSELAALTGYFGCDGVADAEGIQYCTGLTSVTLNYGTFTDMPDMSGMSGLRMLCLEYDAFSAVPEGICNIPGLSRLSLIGNKLTGFTRLTSLYKLTALYLDHCGLDEFPQELLGMHLTSLSLNGNALGALPAEISQMTSLASLAANDTGLTKLPSALYELENLTSLSLNDNEIESLSSSVSNLRKLQWLFLDHNGLKSLPDSLCGMETLIGLSVAYNDLDALPEDIGLHVCQLFARGNRIASIPQSIVESDGTLSLDLALNRLTSLPQGIEATRMQMLNLQYNFLDVSEGSRWRRMLDANPTVSKKYMKQLTLPVVSTQVASDSITLAWTPGVDGEAGQARWKVTGYAVYRYENGALTGLAELDSDTRSFTHAELQPASTYAYRVAVVYSISDEEEDFSGTVRGYASAEATTLAAAPVSPTPAVSGNTSTPAPSTVSSVGTTETVGMVLRERPGIPWPVYVGAGGALLAGAGVATVLTIRKRRRTKKPE